MLYNICKTNKIKHLAVIFILLIFISCGNSSKKEKPKAESGVLNLSEWNFNSDGIVNLNGQWEFYWNELINPVTDTVINIKPELITVPKLWNKFIENNKPIGSYGYATYRLKILVPEKNTIYSLKVGRIETAYKIFINDKFINEVGKVGNLKEEMQSAWIPQEYSFYADTTEINIIIQVSNFNHRKGGIAKSIQIGNPQQISKTTRLLVGFEIFLLGAIIIMTLYYLGLFLMRREDKSTLFFFLASLSTGIYTTVNGEFIASRLIPDFNWVLLVKLNFITNYARIALFALFLGYLFYKEIAPKIVRGIAIWAGAMILFVIFTPSTLFSRTLIFLIIIAMFTVVYLTIGITRATIKKRSGAVYSLIGTIGVLLTTINDSLLDYGILDSIFLISFGLFILIFFQAVMLSKRSADSFRSSENMTDRLLKLDNIQKELLSISSFDLGNTLQILNKNFKTDRALLFLATDFSFNVYSEVEKDEIKIYENQKDINITWDDNILKESVIENTDLVKSHETDNSDYFKLKNIDTIISAPIFENNKLKAILYFELKTGNNFEKRTLEVLSFLKSQIANIIDNALIYLKLEDLNKNLELKVQKRTAELNRQKQEIEQKNVEMDEMIEELKVTTDIVESVNREREDKNTILENQKQEIMEKHEELLQQREEILTINEVLEKRQEEILNKNSELETQKDQITKKNQQITDSIEYARRIQLALLKSEKNIPFKDNLILYRPRDIVSGDFYWIKKFFNYVVIAAADCTGHGVPGAFMSMLGISFLNEVANRHFRKISKARLSASLILEDLRESVIKALSSKDERSQNKDGMDISLCIIDKDTNLMQFAAAYNPAYIIRENNIIELEADKMPIGLHVKETKPFFNREFQLLDNDRLYLFSDGYIDQFGGLNGRKFLKNNFKELLIKIHQLPMDEQYQILLDNHLKWKAGLKQTDDILVMGFQI